MILHLGSSQVPFSVKEVLGIKVEPMMLAKIRHTGEVKMIGRDSSINYHTRCRLMHPRSGKG